MMDLLTSLPAELTTLLAISVSFIVIALFHHFSKEMKLKMENDLWNTGRFTIHFENLDKIDTKSTQFRKLVHTNEFIKRKRGKRKSLWSDERYQDEITTSRSEDVLCTYLPTPISFDNVRITLKDWLFQLEKEFHDAEKRRMREAHHRTELSLIIGSVLSVVTTIAIYGLKPCHIYIIAMESVLISLLLLCFLSFILYSYAENWKKPLCGLSSLISLILFLFSIWMKSPARNSWGDFFYWILIHYIYNNTTQINNM